MFPSPRAPRRRPEAAATLALVLLTSSGLAPAAYGHELQRTNGGSIIRWPEGASPEVNVSASLSRELARATRFAFDAWGRHLAPGARPEYAGRSGSAGPARDGLCVVFATTDWPYGDVDRLLAYTELFYDVNTGEIFEGDISLNEEGFDFRARDPTALDPESVLLHEVGHWLGLAHSCGDPSTGTPSCFSLPEPDRDRILGAVMAPSLGPGETAVVLTEDDRMGLLELYPQGFIRTSSLGLSSVEVSCEDGGLVVYGQALPAAPEVFLRREDGDLERMDSRERSERELKVAGAIARSSTESVDLLVLDPASGERVSLLDVSLEPVRCEADGGPRPPPADEGCDCRSSGSGASVGLGLAALSMLLLGVRRRGLVIFTWVALFGAFSADAFAYRCSRVDFDEGPSLYWGERQIGFFIDEALVADEVMNLEFRQELITSLAVWTDVPCSDFELSVLGTKVVRAGYNQEGENENVITFVDGSEGWAYSSAIIAVTTNTFETTTGRIIDSDIEVNDHHFDLVIVRDASCDPMTGVMDLQNTVTHEVGHVIGLDHPPNSRTYAETTMFASAPSCETKKRTLADDDIAGLCDIYPSGMPVAQCFPPNGPLFTVVEQDDGFGGCSTLGRPLGLEWAGLLLLFGLGALMRRAF